MLDGAPLAHGAQRERGDDGDADCPHESASQGAKTRLHRATTRALEIHERIPDEPTAETGDHDRREGHRPGRPRR